jgi:hypothetical protein
MMDQLELNEQEIKDLLQLLEDWLHEYSHMARRSGYYQRLENLEEKLRASQSGL